MSIILLVIGAFILALSLLWLVFSYLVPAAIWRWASGVCGVELDCDDKYEPKL